MALIQCSECGQQISDKANTCIHCGCPINNEKCSFNEKVLDLLEKLGIYAEFKWTDSKVIAKGVADRGFKVVKTARPGFTNEWYKMYTEDAEPTTEDISKITLLTMMRDMRTVKKILVAGLSIAIIATAIALIVGISAALSVSSYR